MCVNLHKLRYVECPRSPYTLKKGEVYVTRELPDLEVLVNLLSWAKSKLSPRLKIFVLDLVFLLGVRKENKLYKLEEEFFRQDLLNNIYVINKEMEAKTGKKLLNVMLIPNVLLKVKTKKGIPKVLYRGITVGWSGERVSQNEI